MRRVPAKKPLCLAHHAVMGESGVAVDTRMTAPGGSAMVSETAAWSLTELTVCANGFLLGNE
jgi:hypothetical protein